MRGYNVVCPIKEGIPETTYNSAMHHVICEGCHSFSFLMGNIFSTNQAVKKQDSTEENTEHLTASVPNEAMPRKQKPSANLMSHKSHSTSLQNIKKVRHQHRTGSKAKTQAATTLDTVPRRSARLREKEAKEASQQAGP